MWCSVPGNLRDISNALVFTLFIQYFEDLLTVCNSLILFPGLLLKCINFKQHECLWDGVPEVEVKTPHPRGPFKTCPARPVVFPR